MTHHNSYTKQQHRALLPLACLAVLLPLTTLGGCAKVSKRHFTVGSVPQTYKTNHPIKIDEQEQTLDIPVASQTYELPRETAGVVVGFATGFKKSANGAITIMLPSSSPNEAAARMVGNKIADVLRRNNIPTHRISFVSYHAEDHGSAAPIRLSYMGVKASVGACGKWNADLTETSENRNYKNFGCASQSNLAAIVSNPADLIGPRGSTGIDAARRSKVIKDYREASPTYSQGTFDSIPRTFTKGID